MTKSFSYQPAAELGAMKPGEDALKLLVWGFSPSGRQLLDAIAQLSQRRTASQNAHVIDPKTCGSLKLAIVNATSATGDFSRLRKEFTQ
jgi:hypothetical protein